MRKYSEEHFLFDESSDICLQICPADIFEPVPGKFNILFTMWEALEVPNKYVLALNRADLIIVPSRFCRDLFKKYTNKPIEVCFEGVDPSLYPFHQRIIPFYGQKFRFLWVGAPNPRKGYQYILEAVKLVEQIPEIELYIKTTIQKFDRKKYITNLWNGRREIRKLIKTNVITDGQSVREQLKRAMMRKKEPDEGSYQEKGRYGNIIFDTRKLPFSDLVGLYNSAHCFLFPTLGEGWGLTQCEAMATGCPCIATAVTGCADFFDDSVGYTLNYDVKEYYLANYDVRAGLFFPDTKDLIEKMIYVIRNYREALRKGKLASERIHGRFTWEKSAQRLADIIHRYATEREMEGVLING